MEAKEQKRSVDPQELAQLGFPQQDIDEAVHMEKLGLFKMEPSPDLVQRTIEKCIPLLREPKTAAEQQLASIIDPVSIVEGYCATLQQMSPALRASAEWNEFSALQGLQQACLMTVAFAQSRRERPFLMIDNHNVIEPAWWGHDTGFRAFWNACQIVNRISVEHGVPRAACVAVLRPRLFDYSDDDLATIDDMVRKGWSDVWWLPL